jgi:hypothetical protein
MERRDAETSVAGLTGATEGGSFATEEGSLCAQPIAVVQLNATEIKTPLTTLHPILIRFIVIL